MFHNGSNYANHLIIKLLPEEFKGQFQTLRENTEKKANGSAKAQKIKFIDSMKANTI